VNKTNYIAYSLWGDKPIYNVGILKNIQQASEFYPGWKVVVYYDNTVPVATVEKIKAAQAKAVDMTGKGYGMFWRFHAADIPDCGYVVFRDCDSRLSVREKAAVDEWIDSGKAIHIMRDHPFHRIPHGSDVMSILGGMWGIKGNLLPMAQMIERFSAHKNLDYGSDQTFLKEIFLQFREDAKVHDEFFSDSPFPVQRQGYRFIGERMDENDKPVGNDWQEIRNYYSVNRQKKRFSALLSKVYQKMFR
jgi:hypothetical protein